MFSSKDTQSEVSYINAWHKKQTALASAFRLLSEACSAAARELQDFSLPYALPLNGEKVKHVAVEQSATENSIFSSSEIQMIQESTPELQADVTEVKKRKARDPNQPKRPLSAYLSFQLKTRQAVKDSLGESATQKEILSEIAERWSKLNDDERKPFEEEARKAREQYDKEMTAYRSSESKNNSNALLTKENPVETHIKTPPLQKDLEESKESLKTVSIVEEVNDTNTSKNNINEVVKEKKRKHKKKGDGSHLSSDGNASLKEEKKERKKHKKKEGHVEKG
ncbi:uncharacterized protein T551_01393 [Pneumocystis jirovecii RU7]|uniref:HMG box domain-containing protein n=1 Tax=Pneumocystis jirovecii (strain RU7) TaxID=1408657 RepID=A0A0W4ZSG3_PNEJ7|nr:uncharacterized protein T551_01393 [Pneumocystis jirovecii RU7]KTW31321.1 hypothetical protein T551_01393 [Pneumocystis jirovecii RU7]